MNKDKNRKQTQNRFDVGNRGGCEASLFEFRECRPGEALVSAAQSSEPSIVRIAAVTFDEALAYLHWDDPGFVIESVQNVGLIVMVSGSPLD